jgi:TPR repeat protein
MKRFADPQGRFSSRLRATLLVAAIACCPVRVVCAPIAPNPPAAVSAPSPPGRLLSSAEWAAQAPVPQGMYAYKAKLIRNVKDRRVDVLHSHFESQVDELLRGAVSDQFVNRMFTMVSMVDESDAGVFDTWTDSRSKSHIGPLARAYFNLHRAWKGRGTDFARDTSTAEFDEMNRWLPMVRRDAQLALQREPRCSLCYAVLIRLSMPLGLDKEAQEWFTQGLAVNRDSLAVPVAYYDALHPRWGGSRDEQVALADKLRLAGHERAARRLQAQFLADDIQFWNWRGAAQATPGLAAARASMAIDDTYTARYAHAYALQTLGRHDEAIEGFNRIADEYDSTSQLFETRAYSYAQGKRWAEALRDLRIAYLDFLSPWAFEVLVKLSAGNSGWGLRTDPAEAPELCKEAALRGLPMAMTCLGGMYFFGQGGVVKDDVQARQWFRRAADAGDAQGMMDLAQMCVTGQGGATDRDQAIRLWIAAAKLNHPQAQGKLDTELNFSERVRYVYWPELVANSKGWLRAGLRVLEYLFAK